MTSTDQTVAERKKLHPQEQTKLLINTKSDGFTHKPVVCVCAVKIP